MKTPRVSRYRITELWLTEIELLNSDWLKLIKAIEHATPDEQLMLDF